MSNKQFICGTCNKAFAQLKSQKNCEERHNLPFIKCNKCSKEFQGDAKLNKHQLTCGVEKQFRCTKCNKKAYHTEAKFKEHFEICGVDPKIECTNNCGLKFVNENKLKNHLKKCGKVTQKFECPNPNCKKVYVKESAYNNHILTCNK